MNRFMTTDDAAKYVGVIPSHVQQLILENRLKSEKVGRDHLIEESELKNYSKHGKKKRGRPTKYLEK
jgi:site-specific DNA-methyltransferase (adenine-specific)